MIAAQYALFRRTAGELGRIPAGDWRDSGIRGDSEEEVLAAWRSRPATERQWQEAEVRLVPAEPQVTFRGGRLYAVVDQPSGRIEEVPLTMPMPDAGKTLGLAPRGFVSSQVGGVPALASSYALGFNSSAAGIPAPVVSKDALTDRREVVCGVVTLREMIAGNLLIASPTGSMVVERADLCDLRDGLAEYIEAVRGRPSMAEHIREPRFPLPTGEGASFPDAKNAHALPLIDEFLALAARFEGVTLECRKSAPRSGGWAAPWRARVVSSKNERHDYRITRYGFTPEDASASVLRAVERSDRGIRDTEPAQPPSATAHAVAFVDVTARPPVIRRVEILSEPAGDVPADHAVMTTLDVASAEGATYLEATKELLRFLDTPAYAWVFGLQGIVRDPAPDAERQRRTLTPAARARMDAVVATYATTSGDPGDLVPALEAPPEHVQRANASDGDEVVESFNVPPQAGDQDIIAAWLRWLDGGVNIMPGDRSALRGVLDRALANRAFRAEVQRRLEMPAGTAPDVLLMAIDNDRDASRRLPGLIQERDAMLAAAQRTAPIGESGAGVVVLTGPAADAYRAFVTSAAACRASHEALQRNQAEHAAAAGRLARASTEVEAVSSETGLPASARPV